MRSKSLIEKEIEKVVQFDQDDSVDQKKEEKEQEKIANFENIFEKTLNNNYIENK